MRKEPLRGAHSIGHKVATQAILCRLTVCATAIGLLSSVTTAAQGDDERVYLVHADELKYDSYGPNPLAQVANGNVHFIHQGADMWCDSAYFFQESNAMQAFGHVKFVQGDTLSLVCEYADYDGQTQLMAARRNVVMRHNEQTLYTDSMNYDRLYSNAYFFEGGKLIDESDELVADWGSYNTVTRQAVFYYNVKLRGEKHIVTTDTLYYDMQTSLAHVTGPSEITSGTSVVRTEDAYLNSETDISELYGRSTLTDNGKTITADSLFHNNQTGDNDGFGRVVYRDEDNGNGIDCDRLFYNDSTGFGYATGHVVMKEYSQGDTLFVHSDSLKLYTYNIDTDSVQRVAHSYYKVRAYRSDLQAVCDSMVFASADSCLTLYRDPIVWNGNRQILGEVITVYMNDSTVRQADVAGQALAVELVDEEGHFNQISSQRMDAFFIDGAVREVVSTGNVKSIYHRIDENDSVVVELNYLETDTLRMYMSPERQLQRIRTSRAQATMYPITQVPPERRQLPEFQWFDYVRPTDKHDIFDWRAKGAGKELKTTTREAAPPPATSARRNTEAVTRERQ